MSNSYRYYQCESRTNQSVCNYHTRRADDLEAQVRAGAERRVRRTARGFPQAGDDAAVLAEQHDELDRHRARLRAIDRRIEGYIDAAAKGRLAKEKMHNLSVAAAGDRLAVEDALEAAERRIAEHLSASDRKRGRERDVAHLLDAWDEVTFAERQSALRDAVARVTVTDDQALSLTLRA